MKGGLIIDVGKSFITSRCCARASRTQETTQSQGTAVTNADKQGIGVSDSPKAAAPGYVEGHVSMQLTGIGTTWTGAQVEHGRCTMALCCRTLEESSDKAQEDPTVVEGAAKEEPPFQHNGRTAPMGRIKCARPQYKRSPQKGFANTGGPALVWYGGRQRCM